MIAEDQILFAVLGILTADETLLPQPNLQLRATQGFQCWMNICVMPNRVRSRRERNSLAIDRLNSSC
ncbi:hypothetical protein AB0758_44905 [Tolypothrix bouteillei VB521301_2]|uniref:hypothetical protein n=1 Tax=Tolypothrix bouteillei TaxID=1246981 RepID=UPI0038B4D935